MTCWNWSAKESLEDWDTFRRRPWPSWGCHPQANPGRLPLSLTVKLLPMIQGRMRGSTRILAVRRKNVRCRSWAILPQVRFDVLFNVSWEIWIWRSKTKNILQCLRTTPVFYPIFFGQMFSVFFFVLSSIILCFNRNTENSFFNRLFSSSMFNFYRFLSPLFFKCFFFYIFINVFFVTSSKTDFNLVADFSVVSSIATSRLFSFFQI